jgi:Uma2 family endonuclease
MSSIATQVPPAPPEEPVFPLSVEQYHAMIEAGVLTEDDPVELVEGLLVFKMPKKPKHTLVVRLLAEAIAAMLPSQWHFRSQEPVTLPDGEPEPDGAIVRGQPRDYARKHPGPPEVALVIEVADATLRRDRGIKLRSYARAGIPVYWIIDLASRTIEIYSNPDPRAQPPNYREHTAHQENATIPVRLGEQQVGEIRAGSLLP